MGGPDWTLLPDVPLTGIYACLSDADRHSMALVCSRWSRVFGRPCLWRYRHVRFGGMRSSRNEAQRAVGYCRANGHHLKYLRITCEHPSFSTCKRFQKAMADVFIALIWRNTSLRHFFMSQLNMDRYWRYDFTRERLAASVARFLKKQTELELFDMSESMCSANTGFKLLDALASGSSRKLQIMNIEDFFQTRLSIFTMNRYLSIMNRFQQLTTLYINYNCVSETLVRNLALTCANKLHFLSIKVYKHDPHYHIVDNFTWQFLKQSCPRLHVTMYFESIGNYDEIVRLIPKETPLHSLNIWTGVHHANEIWRLSETLKYLGDNFGQRLEDVSLGLENGREAIDEALLYMLTKCKRLEYLDLQTGLLVPTIAGICQMQKEYISGLIKCHISLENLTGLEIVQLEMVKEQYRQMIQERALDFRLVANELPFF